MKYEIRQAAMSDVEFLADTIIEAEKSGTPRCGLALYFDISESELRKYIIQMLEEEVDGCEFSVSSFMVATFNGKPVAALSGWLEGSNEDGLTSSMLKSNLISFVFPPRIVAKTKEKLPIVKEIQIERKKGAYHFEYAYVDPDHSGNKLMQKLMLAHFDRAKELDPNTTEVYSHPFSHNETIILVHEQMGFRIVKKYKSTNPLTIKYYPSDTLYLMEAEI